MNRWQLIYIQILNIYPYKILQFLTIQQQHYNIQQNLKIFQQQQFKTIKQSALQFITQPTINKQQKMYETLTGKHITKQKIINSIYQSSYYSSITSSNNTLNIIDNNNNYNLLGLCKILNNRNNRYIDKKTYLDIPFIGNIVYEDKYKNQGNDYWMNMGKDVFEGEGKMDMDVYDCHQNQKMLIREFQEFYCSRYDCDLQIQQIQIQKSVNYQYLQPISKSLRIINNQYRMNNNNESFYYGDQILRISISTDIIKQMLRHVYIVEIQNYKQISILKIIYQFYQDLKKRKCKQIPLLLNKPSTPQEKKLKIYYLFLFQQQKRIKLNDILFHENAQEIFKIIQQYDKLFDNTNNHTIKQLQEFCNKIRKWINKQNDIYYNYLASALSYQYPFQICIQMQDNFEFQLCVLVFKTIKWMQVRIDDQKQRQKFHDLIIKYYQMYRNKLLDKYEFQDNNTFKKKLLYLYLIDYQRALNCQTTQLEKIQILLLICSQAKKFRNLFKCTRSNLQVQDFQIQLGQFIKQICRIPSQYQFVVDCLKFVNYRHKKQILLSSKQFIQFVDWRYFCSLIPKQEKNQLIILMKQVINQSIQIYKNTAKFLNLGTQQLSYFQIQTLIKGFVQILNENVSVTQKQSQQFYGMISSFRVLNLSDQYQFSMILLEMCLQWYVIRAALFAEDHRKIAEYLKINLEQLQSQETNLSVSMSISQMQRTKSKQLKHNYQFVNKIGNSYFIKNLIQKPDFQNLYIDYLYTVGDGICRLMQIKKKNYRRDKIIEWTQILLMKIQFNLQETKGIFHKNLSQLKKILVQNFSKCYKS